MVLPPHARVVLDLPRQQRPALLELAQYVAAEGRVRLQELGPPALPRMPAALAAHAREDERQVLDRVDEGVPLEEPALLPQQPVELRAVEGPEPAPEHEVLWRRHSRDRVDLEEPEPADGIEDTRRGAVEQLGSHRNPARLVLRDFDQRATLKKVSTMADNEPEELHLPEILVLERLDGPTLEWFHGQRRAIAVARGEPVPRDVGETRRWLGERPEAVPVA